MKFYATCPRWVLPVAMVSPRDVAGARAIITPHRPYRTFPQCCAGPVRRVVCTTQPDCNSFFRNHLWIPVAFFSCHAAGVSAIIHTLTLMETWGAETNDEKFLLRNLASVCHQQETHPRPGHRQLSRSLLNPLPSAGRYAGHRHCRFNAPEPRERPSAHPASPPRRGLARRTPPPPHTAPPSPPCRTRDRQASRDP